MRIIATDRALYVRLDHEQVTVQPEDRLYLDPTGIEFEHRASSTCRFIPWTEVREVWQPMDGHPAYPDSGEVHEQSRAQRGRRTAKHAAPSQTGAEEDPASEQRPADNTGA